MFSPLAQGLLTNRYLRGIPAGSRAAREAFLTSAEITEGKLAMVRALDALARARGQSLAQMAISWVLRPQPSGAAPVTSALIGASSVAQLEDCLGALAAPAFAADELVEIDRILASA